MAFAAIWKRVTHEFQGRFFGWSEERLKHSMGRSSLIEANLSGYDLRYSQFQNSNLAGATINQTSLLGSDFSLANFEGATIHNSFFDKSILCGASFIGADLSGTGFEGADLRGVDFSGASNLKAYQLRYSHRDNSTVLPEGLTEALISAAEEEHELLNLRLAKSSPASAGPIVVG